MTDSQTPESRETLREQFIDIMLDEDKDPNFVTGWHLDVEKAADKLMQLHTAASLAAQKELLELAFDDIGGEDIKVRAWVAKRKAQLERQQLGKESGDEQ